MQAVLVMFRSDGERRSFSLSREMTVIGRRQDCDLMIPLNEISRKHCRFIRDGDELRLEDLGSSNGTFCNGRRIQEAVLQPGDTVQVGPVTFVVQIDGHPADDEIQPFANSSGGDTDVQAIDHDEAPFKPRRSGGASRAAALGAGAAAIGAAAQEDDDDALQALPDDDDDLIELPDDQLSSLDDEDGLVELPSEDDLLNDLSKPPADQDEEPLDILDDAPPAPPAPRAPKPPAPRAPEPIEDELDVLEDETPLAESLDDSTAPHALDTHAKISEVSEDAPLAFDDPPNSLNEAPLDEEPLALDDSPISLGGETYREPGEPPAPSSPSTYDDILGAADHSPEHPAPVSEEPLSFDEPLDLADPLTPSTQDSLEEATEPAAIEEPHTEDHAAPHQAALPNLSESFDAASDSEIPTLETDADILETESYKPEPTAAEHNDNTSPALTDDLSIGHHHEAPAHLHDHSNPDHNEDPLALTDEDAAAPLDFSETGEDLLEFAEDSDPNHTPLNEDELLDLMGNDPIPPHKDPHSPTDHSANH